MKEVTVELKVHILIFLAQKQRLVTVRENSFYIIYGKAAGMWASVRFALRNHLFPLSSPLSHLPLLVPSFFPSFNGGCGLIARFPLWSCHNDQVMRRLNKSA